MGGLSKKAFQLNRLRENPGPPALTLDSGNLLFKPGHLTGARLDQAKIAAAGIARAYDLMRFDAVAVGNSDLAGGLDFLLDLNRRAAFPWLSANLVRRGDSSPLFTPYTVITRDDLTIGVIGITNDNAQPRPVLPDDVVILPWRRVLPDTVAGLKDKCDLVILLSNYSLAENRAIADSVDGIRLIIQSSPSPANLPPLVVKNTLICQTGKQGKYLGWLRINRQKSWQPGNRQEEDATPSTFSNSYISMTTSLPDQPEILALVKRIKEDISRAGQRTAREAKSAARTGRNGRKPGSRLDRYTGWQACAECHPDQAAFWQTTRHGAAYQALVAKQQQFNLTCLTCHVTPAPPDQGQSLLTLPLSLRSVGCETCHGPDRGHGNNPAAVSLSRQPLEMICRRCHTPEHDADFNYGEKRQLISCPAGSGPDGIKQAD
ncbi:MAG: hypothetical protein L3J03_00365 [Desulfobacterales bacterium]|nr:hypothetical protein [Desulfobacterales bacterium]